MRGAGSSAHSVARAAGFERVGLYVDLGRDPGRAASAELIVTESAIAENVRRGA